jgi:hypothetical protein
MDDLILFLRKRRKIDNGLINPHGPEAADLLEAQAAQLQEARTIIRMMERHFPNDLRSFRAQRAQVSAFLAKSQ